MYWGALFLTSLASLSYAGGDNTAPNSPRTPSQSSPSGQAVWMKYSLTPITVKIHGGIKENLSSRFTLIDLWEEHSVLQFIIKNEFKTTEIGAVTGKVLDKYTLTFLDLTRNGKFGDIPGVEQVMNENKEHLWSLIDGVIVNNAKDCLPASRTIALDKTLYEVRVDPAGAYVEIREYRGPTGVIVKGGKYSSVSIQYLIVRGGNNFFLMEDGKDLTVPTGTYSLWRGGFIVARKESRPIPGSSLSYTLQAHWGFKHGDAYVEGVPTEFPVEKGGKTKILCGGPARIVAMEYGFYPDGTMEIVNMTAKGAGGELLNIAVADIGNITIQLKDTDDKVITVKPLREQVHELSP